MQNLVISKYRIFASRAQPHAAAIHFKLLVFLFRFFCFCFFFLYRFSALFVVVPVLFVVVLWVLLVVRLRAVYIGVRSDTIVIGAAGISFHSTLICRNVRCFRAANEKSINCIINI